MSKPDSDDAQRTGRLMLIMAWVGGLALLTLLFQDLLEARLNPNANPVVAEGPDGRALTDGAQVLIGGNESYESLCRIHWREAVGDRSAPATGG